MRFTKTCSLLGLGVLVLTAEAPAQNCTQTSVGTVPLQDLGAGTYQGFQGGLYPGGTNARPAVHASAGLQSASEIVPRDPAGNPDPAGEIGFISIGMSNTRNHFLQFVPLANADPDRAAHVTVINAAQGGQPAEDIDDPLAPYWGFVDNAVSTNGMTNAQVQVVWMLQANRAQNLPPFPTHSEGLRDQLITICQILQDRFPNLRQVWLGTRIYAGYAVTALNPEPFAYETGFSNKWVIEEQIDGNPALNYDASNGPVEAPWIAWGPYAWADGLTANSDGLTWECSDFNADGTHPSPQGSLKMANLLLDFFKSDEATTWWFGDDGPPDPSEPGTSFCFGDGGDQMGCVDCPCNNNAPVGSLTGCLNGVGTGAALVFAGEPSVGADTLEVGFTGANPSTFGVLVSGGARLPGPNSACPVGTGISTGFFDGLRCIGAGAIRHGARSTGATGARDSAWSTADQNGGIVAFGGYSAGQTRHFMLVYREFSSLVCMTGQNTSNGYTLQFTP